MNKMTKLLLVCAPVMLFAACGGDDDLDDRLDIADPKVRVVHAVPAGPNIALYRDQQQQADATNLAYKSASKYFDVSTSNATWTVRTNPGGAIIGTTAFEAQRGNKYTLVAVPDAGTGAELMLVSDPYNKGLGTDKARIRVLNAAFNAPDVDVYVNDPNVDIATVSPVFSSVDYKASNPASGSDSNEFAAGNKTYWLTVAATGTKVPVFRAAVNVPDNGDWVVTLLPDSIAPYDVKVLVVKANDDNSTAEEVANTL